MKNTIVLKNSDLILFAFSSVFYSRIIAATIRFSLLNLVHFAIIPLVCLLIVFSTKSLSKKQIETSYALIIGLAFLFGVSVLSALFNGAGVINAIVSFMMLGEPFIFILALNAISLTPPILVKIKKFLYYSVLINFVLAAVQKPLIDMGYLYAIGLNGTDGCGGVFFPTGAGNYVSASVSFTFAVYLLSAKDISIGKKTAVMLAAGWHILFSDSKQLVFAYGLAWVLLIVFNTQNITKTLKLLIAFSLIGLAGIWLVRNVEQFSGFLSWARPELYGENGLAWYAKFYSIYLIRSHLISDWHWLVGLGPGHGVSRLGAWFLQDYANILNPLGATTTQIGQQSRDFIASFWLTSGSSLFSPIFGWAGILGDLGIFGLLAYLYLGFLVWRYFAFYDTIKFLILGIVVIGFIFTQMEEPGFMIFIAFILGISRQEKEVEQQKLQAAQATNPFLEIA